MTCIKGSFNSLFILSKMKVKVLKWSILSFYFQIRRAFLKVRGVLYGPTFKWVKKIFIENILSYDRWKLIILIIEVTGGK